MWSSFTDHRMYVVYVEHGYSHDVCKRALGTETGTEILSSTLSIPKQPLKVDDASYNTETLVEAEKKATSCALATP